MMRDYIAINIETAEAHHLQSTRRRAAIREANELVDEDCEVVTLQQAAAVLRSHRRDPAGLHANLMEVR